MSTCYLASLLLPGGSKLAIQCVGHGSQATLQGHGGEGCAPRKMHTRSGQGELCTERAQYQSAKASIGSCAACLVSVILICFHGYVRLIQWTFRHICINSKGHANTLHSIARSSFIWSLNPVSNMGSLLAVTIRLCNTCSVLT